MRQSHNALPQAFQATIVEVARVLQRFPQMCTDLSKIEPFKEEHLKRRPLLFVQFIESCVQLLARHQISELLFPIPLSL